MFQIVEVPSGAASLTEQLGTKPKFWYDEGNKRRLFKEVRAGTGEDWSEKVASELCALLHVPHAPYELAIWRGKRGVVTDTFVPDGARLVHGNELLVRFIPDYPGAKFFRVRQHTLRRVLAIAEHVSPPIGFTPFGDVESAVDVFVGYLMVDVWIANQDRHHENWGLVSVPKNRIIHLAPSYDHASSLGRIETDEEKRDRLHTRDRNRTVERYVERATSAFYASETSAKPLSTLEAFISAATLRPKAAISWLKRLESVSSEETEAILREVPQDRLSDVSTEFAQRILVLNRRRLLGCMPGLLND
jgi:hypothetical protein